MDKKCIMKKKLQLKIQEPCHENWDRMSPSEQGRFCGSCEKTVVDFSGMSDAQLVAFFKKPSTGSICGRFFSDQLDRPLSPPQKRMPWLRYFLTILLPAFFFMRSGAQKTVGKIAVYDRDTTRFPVGHEIRTLGMVMPTEILPVNPDTTVKKVPLVTKVKQVKVNGRVVDEDGNVIPAASITITQSGKILSADAEGRFRFITASDKLIELVTSSVGFTPEVYAYPFTLQYSEEVDITIQMKRSVKALDEALVSAIGCGLKRQYIAGGVNVVRGGALKVDTPVIKPVPVVTGEPRAKFYPNPARAGQRFYISFNEPDEGYYDWQLLDIQGKIIEKKSFWIDAKATVMETTLPLVSSGTYIAVLVNRKTGKRFSEKVIID
jgi:hypothetical protein